MTTSTLYTVTFWKNWQEDFKKQWEKQFTKNQILAEFEEVSEQDDGSIYAEYDSNNYLYTPVA